MPSSRQGQAAAPDELAVAWALGVVARPSLGPAEIGKLLDRPRQTVWRWLNDQADLAEDAYDDAVADGTIEGLVAAAKGDADEPEEPPPPVAPVFAEVVDVFREILEQVWVYGIGFVDAAVMCHVPRARAMEFERVAAEELEAGQSTARAMIWHLHDQVRTWRGARQLQKVGRGKSGWQAKHASLKALHGDLLERAAQAVEAQADLEDASVEELFAAARGQVD